MTSLHFTWFDYSILTIIFVSIFISLVRGFLREAMSLITWVTAFYLAFRFSSALGSLLKPYITHDTLRLATSFIVLFIATLIIGALINGLLGHLIRQTGISGTDRLLGMLFGAGRGIFLVALLLLLAEFTAFPKEPWFKQSIVVPQFASLTHWMQQFLPQQLNKTKITHSVA